MTKPATNTNPTTIDPADQTRFNRLAAQWWDPNGPMWPLHGLNQFRIGVLMERLESPLQGLDILDVGCGGGLFSEALAKRGARVTGLDTAQHNIRIASEHAQAQGLSIAYRCAEIRALVAEGRQFDVVMNLEVVEHVADLARFLTDCHAVLKPGGWTFIATINRTWQSWLFAIIGAEYVLRLLPRGTHQWHKFVTPAQLEALLSADDLHIDWRTGVHFNPWTRRFKLTDSLAVNYLLAARKNDV